MILGRKQIIEISTWASRPMHAAEGSLAYCKDTKKYIKFDGTQWKEVSEILQSQIDASLATKADVSSLKTVATTGSYNDLTSKPTIPAAQVSADWNATSGVTQINNKPVIGKIYTTTGATGDAFAMPRKGVTNASGVATIYLTNNNTAGGTAVFSTIYEDGIIAMPVGASSNYQVTNVVVSADKKTLTVTVNQLGSVLLGLVNLTTAAAGVEVRAMVMGK